MNDSLRVIRADNPGPLTLDGTRTYVVGRTHVAVIDPGPADALHLEAIERAVDDAVTEAVCLTHAHPDHSAAAAELAARLGAPIAASPETLGRIGLEGRELSDGDEIQVDDGETSLLALATPGHAADHLCYLWLPGRELFTGDLVLGRGTSVVTWPDGQVGSYLASLARLLTLRPSVLWPGHGDAVTEPLERLREYRAHRLVRGSQIRDAVLRGGARTLDEIRLAVYGSLPPGLDRAAELSILAHLEHLRETGTELPRGTGNPPAS